MGSKEKKAEGSLLAGEQLVVSVVPSVADADASEELGPGDEPVTWYASHCCHSCDVREDATSVAPLVQRPSQVLPVKGASRALTYRFAEMMLS